ncbi:hypothetical protein COB55_04440 [Candidatus Wolfebacteria bacterium]|nr:MAG: hypothetical protein COB55_04440 [Candidatus Wolfebacteria bacterium]
MITYTISKKKLDLQLKELNRLANNLDNYEGGLGKWKLTKRQKEYIDIIKGQINDIERLLNDELIDYDDLYEYTKDD